MLQTIKRWFRRLFIYEPPRPDERLRFRMWLDAAADENGEVAVEDVRRYLASR